MREEEEGRVKERKERTSTSGRDEWGLASVTSLARSFDRVFVFRGEGDKKKPRVIVSLWRRPGPKHVARAET